MLALHTHSAVTTAPRHKTLKVLRLGEALEGEFPFERILVDLRENAQVDLGQLADMGFGAVLSDTVDGGTATIPIIHALHNQDVVAPGDVVRIRDQGQISVLYRRKANANALFITERCNSYCLMCSQPPRDDNDDWRVDELLDLVPLIDRDVPHLAITGGEPTLLGSRLAQVMACVGTHLPNTQLNVLTNARRLANPALADKLTGASQRVLWAVPLYADTAGRHDYVVQAEGAFSETINGLYNLAEHKAAIEIRIVLHRQTIERLLPFAEFIWRTIPVVAHVAFMGLEPMGFAKVNRDLLYVDPLEYRDALEAAAWYLHDRGIVTSIYNTPWCVLPPDIWPLARKSISDWKNMYVSECENCAVREMCGGFFRSAGSNWRSRGIRPMNEEVCTCPRTGENTCVTCSGGQARGLWCFQELQRRHSAHCQTPRP